MEKIFERTYFLTPAECNPQGRMPITLLINRLIEVATLHANQVGIGYAYLVTRHETWVLSRVGVEMKRYPAVNENYTVRTWMSGINRLFSDRDFEILDGNGATIGWARTVWAVLNTDTRQAADMSHMYHIKELFPDDKTCAAAPLARLRPLTQYETLHYRFTYCDIDFNRHVNTVRYIELLLDQWTMEWHDRYAIERFEIAFMHETRYDAEVTVAIAAEESLTFIAEISTAEACSCRARVKFRPRDGKIVAN